MKRMQRTVRMTVAVTFDTFVPGEEVPAIGSAELVGTVERKFRESLTGLGDNPQMAVVLSKLERKEVD